MIAVAFLRGSAWIEILVQGEPVEMPIVAFLRGSAWIEISAADEKSMFPRSHSCEGVRGLK